MPDVITGPWPPRRREEDCIAIMICRPVGTENGLYVLRRVPVCWQIEEYLKGTRHDRQE